MIAGAALAAWLSDREAQKRSHDRVEDSARYWSGEPLMADLERELSDLSEPSAAAVLAAARRFLDRSGEIEALMADLIGSSRSDPFFRPPFHPSVGEVHTALLLFHDPVLSIALAVSGVDSIAAKKAGRSGKASIGFNGMVTLFRYVKAGGATISFWEAPPITAEFVAPQAGRCRFVERRRIEDGEEILVDGRYQSFVIEHAASDMVYFQALVRPDSAPVAVEYDSETLSFIGASSSDEGASRVQMMASVLRAMERTDAMPLLEEALASPHFYTRWHVMRELLALDAEAALPALHRMAIQDPHPEVRAAARQTLDIFFEDETEGPGWEAMQCRA